MTNKTIAAFVAALSATVIWACASKTPPAAGGTSSEGSGADGGGCSPPEDAACQIDPQCGCPSGQKCDLTSEAGAACVKAGEGSSGSSCETPSDCAPGFTCASGVCHPFCSAASVGTTCPALASGGPALGLCDQVTVNAAAVSQDSYCFFACTPSPNTCPAGQGCVIDTVAGENYSDCQAAGHVAPGGTCATTASCAAGATCYADGGASGGVCMQFCVKTADCASLGPTFQCDTTIGLALDGVLYGLCD
jgi:hypothetical protein